MSIRAKVLLFVIGWAVILGGILINHSLVGLTGFYYWPTVSLIAYLVVLCFGLGERDLIFPVVFLMMVPLTIFLDTWLGAAAFGYYAIGFLVGNLFILGSLVLANIKTVPTQLIDIFIFLSCFWIVGPFLFTNFINPLISNYNFITACIHLVVDFSCCFIVIKLIKPSWGRNV
ncbi:MAG TPA: hypothetical protein PK547_00975 [Candidatus Paceibacterota bacterium]|nr:hypothetical protein [Candidatus Paceibacterota bacterium]